MQEITSLEQRVVKIKFYLNQTAQNIIEVGKELTAAKAEVPHGQWQAWLQDNFQLSQMTANRFMRVAERFSKINNVVNFQPSQMFEMLALPAEDTEKFIETKKAEGTPVEDMTVKKLREEIQQFKQREEMLIDKLDYNRILTSQATTRANKAESKLQSLFADIDKLKAENSTLKNLAAALPKSKLQLDLRLNPVPVDREVGGYKLEP